jgi:periplasmic protein CpxP/Spy
MNRQLISKFTGAVVSIALGASTLLALTTGLASAQTPSTQTPSPQTHHESRELSGLNLTQQQRDQIDQIRSQTRSQIESILSETQRTQIRTAMQQGQDDRAAAAANVSADQQAQIRQIFQASRQQMASVLTPDQQQLQQHRRERHTQNRQNSPAQSQP